MSTLLTTSAGAFEAGFYPTAVAYLSFFYCRYDLAVRIALFYGQYAIAGAFSGSIGQSDDLHRNLGGGVTDMPFQQHTESSIFRAP